MSTTETSDAIGAVPPASSEATPMTQMLAGFQVSQALYVVAKLNIATKLAKGPRPLGPPAEETGADEDALRRLLRTLAPLGLFRHGGHDTVEVTSFGELLSASHPASLRDAALYWMETQRRPAEPAPWRT